MTSLNLSRVGEKKERDKDTKRERERERKRNLISIWWITSFNLSGVGE